MGIPVFKLECECGWKSDIEILPLYRAKIEADKHITNSPEGTHYVWLRASAARSIISFVERELEDAVKSKENEEGAIREHKPAST